MKLIVRIRGGLGNQLFSYAAARRLAIFNSAELVIDNVSGFIRDHEFKRQYRLDGFNIAARLATPSERLYPFERYRRAFIKHRARSQNFFYRNYIEEEFPDFDDRILTFKLNAKKTIIDGLWQSSLYFSDIQEVLRNDLKICPPTDKKNIDAALWILKNNAICIHFRLFQNMGNPANVPIEYYEQALSKLSKITDSTYFVLFSDNPSLLSKLLRIPESKRLIVDWNTNNSGELSDLWLMTKCHHFIISNSTFSWWGAWLGAVKKHQTVMFPRKIQSNWAWDYKGQMPITWTPIEI